MPPDADDRPRNSATAASAAGARALSAQLVALYFRAPAKVFFRTRVDYLAYARPAPPPRPADGSLLRRPACWRQPSSATAGASCRARCCRRCWPTPASAPSSTRPTCTSSAASTGRAHLRRRARRRRLAERRGRAPRRAAGALPPRRPGARSRRAPPSLWAFGAGKLRDIGLRGVFAGWALSLAKDILGSAVFFSAFEYVKAQGYYLFVTWYYGGLARGAVDALASTRPPPAQTPVIRPHYALEPLFLLCAGAGASMAQQVVLHPLTRLQAKHRDRLDDLDARAARCRAAARGPRWPMLRAYVRAYRETWAVCAAEAADGGLARWLYRGFWRSALRQVPSTSAGLIIFELIRRKHGFGADEVRITRDGYDIMLH